MVYMSLLTLTSWNTVLSSYNSSYSLGYLSFYLILHHFFFDNSAFAAQAEEHTQNAEHVIFSSVLNLASGDDASESYSDDDMYPISLTLLLTYYIMAKSKSLLKK